MRHSEEFRKFIFTGGMKPPEDAAKHLKNYDNSLELLWDPDANCWNIYKVHQKGLSKDGDIMAFQMAVPQQGLLITKGIVDWLKRYNINPNNWWSVEELQAQWRKLVYSKYRFHLDHVKKRNEELDSYRRSIAEDFIKEKVVVGFNSYTKRPIVAVRKRNASRTPTQ